MVFGVWMHGVCRSGGAVSTLGSVSVGVATIRDPDEVNLRGPTCFCLWDALAWWVLSGPLITFFLGMIYVVGALAWMGVALELFELIPPKDAHFLTQPQGGLRRIGMARPLHLDGPWRHGFGCIRLGRHARCPPQPRCFPWMRCSAP